MKNTPVIIDTDPGTDDAIALLTAKYYGLNIDTLVSTYGNVSHVNTHRNLVNLCGMLNISANIINGADSPIDGTGFTAEEVHGANGVGGVILPIYADNSMYGNYVELIYKRLKMLGKVDYITLGPLTNLAQVILKYPHCVEFLNSITIMGAGFNVSNIPYSAEFNIGCDPTAAKVVFSAKTDINLIPLDVTHKISLDIDEVCDITGFDYKSGVSDSSFRGMFADIMYYNYKTSVEKNDGGALIHDATAIIAYKNPDKFEKKFATVSVDNHGATKYVNGGNVSVYYDTDRNFVIKELKNSYTHMN